MIRKLIFSGICIVVATSLPARADEAYICDAGRIVYVKPGELEHLKKTDPCIAGYYGLEVKTAGTGPGLPTETAPMLKGSAASQSDEAGLAGEGLALERAARAVGGVGAAAKKARPSAAAPKPAPAVAKKLSPLPEARSDFRTVVIINAAPGSEGIYRHEK